MKQYAENQENNELNTNNAMLPEDKLEHAETGLLGRIKADIARQKEYMSSMTLKDRVNYFLFYYKWKIIIGFCLALFLTYIPVYLYQNSRPYAISFAVLNNYSSKEPDDSIITEYLEYYGLTKGYRISTDLNYYVNLAKYQSGNMSDIDADSYEQLYTLCNNGFFDVLISDKPGVHFSHKLNLLWNLDEVLGDELLDELSKKYPDVILGASSSKSKSDSESEGSDYSSGYFIDISDTAFAKSLMLSYEEAYICFPKKQNTLNARRIIKFIFNLDSDLK